MSDAYERERQNNSRLDELSAKVSALRGVTVDIYDSARDQGVIDSTVRNHMLSHTQNTKRLFFPAPLLLVVSAARTLFFLSLSLSPFPVRALHACPPEHPPPPPSACRPTRFPPFSNFHRANPSPPSARR